MNVEPDKEEDASGVIAIPIDLEHEGNDFV